ncbi:WD40-repeat-containing domain protein [Parasitella parasitica]|nr:WD40-repeat-containing domain protein [Parasitella parasitica]
MSEQSTEYTLPGVLHFLQAEWRKFEREKNEWVIERAELKARIALLEGERRGVENIKLTLMKRVKMLEYALRQERKRHAGVTMTTTSEDPSTTTPTTTNPTITDNDIPSTITTTIPSAVSPSPTAAAPTFIDNKLKEKSREVLKSCLQEINYLTSFPSKLPLTNALTSRSPTLSNERSSSIRRAPPPHNNNSNQNSPVLSAAGSRGQQQQQQQQQQRKTSSSLKKCNGSSNASSPIPKKSTLSQREDIGVEVPANVDEVAMINNIKEEKENYSASQDSESLSLQIQEKFHLSEEKVKKLLKHASKGGQSQVDQNRVLAGDFDPNQIGEIDSHRLQPKIWKPRVTIKGHLDSVRTVAFHPKEMIAASGSDDGTVKIWNLQRATGKDGNAAKKGSHEEADPSITFRGHTNVVTAVAISASQNRVYSASLDSSIRVWKLPGEERGPFSPVDPSMNEATYIGHTDAIWDFKLSPDNYHSNLLASASADGTVKIWDTQTSGNLLKSSWTFDGISTEGALKDKVAPTSLDFCQTDIHKIAVSFANAKIRLYDVETGQVIMTMKGSDDSYDNTFATQINCIVSHPTMPIIVSGHEDRHIRFYDLKSGECIQSVSGHLDAVTSLNIDSAGTGMVSGGHDSSIRLWDVASKSCIQEFSAHRRKGDEGVLDAKFHPSFPWMISGGADGIIKAYHHGQ